MSFTRMMRLGGDGFRCAACPPVPAPAVLAVRALLAGPPGLGYVPTYLCNGEAHRHRRIWLLWFAPRRCECCHRDPARRRFGALRLCLECAAVERENRLPPAVLRALADEEARDELRARRRAKR